jgi:hypothetical protein
MNTRVTAYVGLGANLGEARLAIERAFLALEKLPESRLIARSNVFSSAPIEAQGPDFINAVTPAFRPKRCSINCKSLNPTPVATVLTKMHREHSTSTFCYLAICVARRRG